MNELAPILAVCLWASSLTPPPPLEDLERFPPRPVADCMVKIGQSHDCWLKEMQEFDSGEPEWAEWRWEHARNQAAWVALAGAADAGYAENTRRKYPSDLRDALGPENYASATMPPCVPLWRFRRMP